MDGKKPSHEQWAEEQMVISETTHLKPWWAHYHYTGNGDDNSNGNGNGNGNGNIRDNSSLSRPSHVIPQGVDLNHWGNHRSGADRSEPHIYSF